MSKAYEFIDSVEKLEQEIDRVKKAQAIYAHYSQEQVDRIFLAAATAANKARIPLAKAAVAETGMGIVAHLLSSPVLSRWLCGSF